MILEEVLREVIQDQREIIELKLPVKRNLELPGQSRQIVIISGIRRCGKSTLLQQVFGTNSEALFINFEDPRLDGFELADFNKIDKIAAEGSKSVLVFDEIQNINEWEKYARAANDRGLNIYVTGSNASMLSRELGTRLTGRYQQFELFPFDYSEYLTYKGIKAGMESFSDYLQNGGFPEFLVYQNKEYLRILLKDIIIRDIAVRRKIKNEHLLTRLAVYLFSNIGKEFSYNKITSLLNIKSVRSTIDYCDYLRESYLIDLVPSFSFSINQQLGGFKKAYGIDTGMVKANSISFSDDYGRLLENAVFLELRRKYSDIMYFRGNNTECDFLIREDQSVTQAIQVCWHVNEDNVKREILGIKEAIRLTKAIHGIIITFDQEDELDGIPLIPAWKWMG